jgi:hypothetical protein
MKHPENCLCFTDTANRTERSKQDVEFVDSEGFFSTFPSLGQFGEHLDGVDEGLEFHMARAEGGERA